MRVATSGGYLNAGVAYVLHPHRDIWYGSPPCQLNWWLPVYPFESESSFAFHSRYWTEPVPNTSHEYNHYEWNKVGRAQADKQVTSDTRNQPKATAPLELEPDVRVVCPPGGIILFSGAHLHSTVPNTSGRSRFSIDFRTAHHDELANGGGAPPSTGTAPEPPCSSCAGRAISPPYPTRSCGSTIRTRRPPATAWCLGLQPGLLLGCKFLPDDPGAFDHRPHLPERDFGASISSRSQGLSRVAQPPRKAERAGSAPTTLAISTLVSDKSITPRRICSDRGQDRAIEPRLASISPDRTGIPPARTERRTAPDAPHEGS